MSAEASPRRTVPFVAPAWAGPVGVALGCVVGTVFCWILSNAL